MGDDLAKNTFDTIVTAGDKLDFYMKNKFAICDLSPDRPQPGNYLNRVFNGIVDGLQKNILLPKVMVISLDSDPVKRMSKFLPNFTLQRVLQTCSDYLIEVLHNVLATHKNSLPAKAQIYRYPSILWVVPPTHRNFNDNKGRKILASVLE